MAFNTKKALTLLKKELDVTHGHLSFDYTIDEENVGKATASLALSDLDDEVSVFYEIYPNGICHFRAVFDKIEKSVENLSLLNEFNSERNGIHGFIREDGYLEFNYSLALFKEKSILRQGSFLLNLLIACADGSDIIKKLASLTRG